MRRFLVAILVAGFAAAPAWAGGPSPKALYNALLAAPVKGVVPTPTKAGSQARRHHVVGEMLINFVDGHTRIAYVVFPTHADAVGNYTDGIRALKLIHAVRKIKKSVPGLPKPSILVDASQSGVGVTQVSFVAGNVEIAAQSLKLNAKSGNEKLAISLAQLALSHLRKVEKTA